MAWTHAIADEVANEFREAQRLARGIFPRVPNEVEPLPALVLRVADHENKRRRRIVSARGVAA